MTKQTKYVQTVIDELATKGIEALDAMANFTQEQVDHIVHQAAIAALDKHMYLAKLAVDEAYMVFMKIKPSKTCMLLNTFGIVLNMTSQ
ncbi:hypothetical protein Y018_09360 [Streptococcus thermophilus TH982]|nr:hypothetical protein Y018_09360 [Streptococcus thermophilus TH982]